jgi:beta-glucosidase
VATVFPTGVGLAATWNPEVARAAGEAMGREGRALGVHVLLGPNVNIQRTPLAGRNFESYSEDPFLAGKIGVGFVQGVQSQGVGTSPKHFVANEQELERLRSSSNMDERTLREIYLAPFEMIVKEAKPWTIMAAYNRLNGIYMTENAPLLRGVLKGEWGFDGVLMSDWEPCTRPRRRPTAARIWRDAGPGPFLWWRTGGVRAQLAGGTAGYRRCRAAHAAAGRAHWRTGHPAAAAGAT